MGEDQTICRLGRTSMLKSRKLQFFIFGLIILAIFALFIHLRQAVKTDIAARLYQQWNQHYIHWGKDEAYVITKQTPEGRIVLSEAQGYAMYIAVLAAERGEDTQEDFQKLYQYYMNHRTDQTQLMSWRQTVKNGQVQEDPNNATDGDLYIAYALIQAAQLWKDQASEYEEQARVILQDILAYNYNSQANFLTAGNWASQESDYYWLMRSSDTLPQLFETFYDFTKDEQWLSIKASMLEKLEMISAQEDTGLIPDFIWIDEGGEARVAEANAVASAHDGDYYYNACRLPYVLAQSQDKQSQQPLKKMMDFFMEQKSIYAGYSLNGKALDKHQPASFGAPIFYAASKNGTYNKLLQQNKYIFLQDLPSDSYYEAVIVTMIALEILK